MLRRITGIWLAMLLLLAAAWPVAAAEPEVTADAETGEVTILVSGEAGAPAGIRIERANKCYFLDSAYLGSDGTHTFATVLPVDDAEYDAVVNVAGTETTFTIRFEEGGGDNPGGGTNRDTVRFSVDALTIDRGYLVSQTTVTLRTGDTVWSVLERVLQEKGIDYTSDSSGGRYVTSIDGIGEFDHGPGSGWMYSVNGTFPDQAMDKYRLSDGDTIRIRYTTDYGEDVGDNYEEKPPTGGDGGGSTGGSTGGNTGGGNTINVPGNGNQGTDPATDQPALKFTDVPEDHWARSYIQDLVQQQIVSGRTDTLFAPEDNVTRAEFVKLLAAASGAALEAASDVQFEDVPADAWFGPAVAWAAQHAVVNGVDETYFDPDAPITREQVAVMLTRFADSVLQVALPANQDAVTFADASAISEYARDAVTAMQRAGIISGRDNGQFAPGETATRAEAAKMLSLILDVAQQ